MMPGVLDSTFLLAELMNALPEGRFSAFDKRLSPRSDFRRDQRFSLTSCFSCSIQFNAASTPQRKSSG